METCYWQGGRWLADMTCELGAVWRLPDSVRHCDSAWRHERIPDDELVAGPAELSVARCYPHAPTAVGLAR